MPDPPLQQNVAGVPCPAGDADGAEIVARLAAAGCVFAEDEARLLCESAHDPAELDALVARRVAGFPLEQLLGWAGFCGRRVSVDPGVFVPRRRSELLVAEAVGRAAPGAVVVDLCCGSGAIGAAIAAARPDVVVYAADVDPAAVRCARRNLPSNRVFAGDLFDALPGRLRGRVGVLVANAPYVPTGAIGTMPPEARLHEAPVALDGGADGLDVQRRVAAGAPGWLTPGGGLLVETSRHQARGTSRILSDAGLAPSVVRSEDLDATVVAGTRPDVPAPGTRDRSGGTGRGPDHGRRPDHGRGWAQGRGRATGDVRPW